MSEETKARVGIESFVRLTLTGKAYAGHLGKRLVDDEVQAFRTWLAEQDFCPIPGGTVMGPDIFIGLFEPEHGPKLKAYFKERGIEPWTNE